jgi:hypothetical protein
VTLTLKSPFHWIRVIVPPVIRNKIESLPD